MENSFLKFFNNLDKNPDAEWKETVSGKVYSQVEKIAAREKKLASVDGKGSVMETFHIGDEYTFLRKHLENANVGEQTGNIESFVEAWEYRKFPWWKEALDAEGLPVKFLDTPIEVIARDAGMEPKMYQIKDIAERSGLLADTDPFTFRAAKILVTKKTQEILNPVFAPDYEVKFFDGMMRLVPLTPEAHKSRAEVNDVYREALKKFTEAIPSLEEGYRALKGEAESRGKGE